MVKNKKGSKKYLNLSPLLIWIGILIFLLSTLFKVFPFDLYATESYQPKPDYVGPKLITIPSAQINAPITAGGIVNNDWILKDDSVSFLPSSGLPGEGFNTIIYGHKRAGLFLNLHLLNWGDQIILTDQKGREFRYQVYSIKNIDPTDLNALKSNLPDTLTLFTCDGFWDQSRLLIKAKLALNLPNIQEEKIDFLTTQKKEGSSY